MLPLWFLQFLHLSPAIIDPGSRDGSAVQVLDLKGLQIPHLPIVNCCVFITSFARGWGSGTPSQVRSSASVSSRAHVLVAVHWWTIHKPRHYRKTAISSSAKLCAVDSRFELHETCFLCVSPETPAALRSTPHPPLSVHCLSSFSDRLSDRRMVFLFFDYLPIQLNTQKCYTELACVRSAHPNHSCT